MGFIFSGRRRSFPFLFLMGHHAEDFRTTLFFYTFVDFGAVWAFDKTLFVELFHDGVEEFVLETRGEFREG